MSPWGSQMLFMRHQVLNLGVCLALVVGAPTIPVPLPEDATPSLTVRGHELPVGGLVENPNIRIEKQAQTHRQGVKKPGWVAYSSSTTAVVRARPSPQRRQIFRSLPRRFLPELRIRPGPSDERSDPFLS